MEGERPHLLEHVGLGFATVEVDALGSLYERQEACPLEGFVGQEIFSDRVLFQDSKRGL